MHAESQEKFHKTRPQDGMSYGRLAETAPLLAQQAENDQTAPTLMISVTWEVTKYKQLEFYM